MVKHYSGCDCNCPQLLSKTLTSIQDDKWVCQLAAESTGYLSTYNNSLEEKVSIVLMVKDSRDVTSMMDDGCERVTNG